MGFPGIMREGEQHKWLPMREKSLDVFNGKGYFFFFFSILALLKNIDIHVTPFEMQFF